MVEKTDADQLWRQHNEWEKSEDTQGVSSVETRGMKTEEKNIQELALIGARIPSFTTTKAFSGSSSGCMTLSLLPLLRLQKGLFLLLLFSQQ